jgi:hypothetical protein
METKFTKDGKKVIVLGKLNSEESIVQEIFINNGQEIPAGENFVTKGLLDFPIKSWKESNLIEIEKDYDKKKKEIEKRMDDLRKTEYTTIQALKAKLNALKSYVDTDFLKAFEMVSDFLTNKIKYVIMNEYNPKIIEYDYEKLMTYNESRYSSICFDGVKLLSLFGKSEGDLTFRIHNYSDGSGGSSEILFFKTLEEAKEKLKEICDNKKEYNNNTIEQYKKYGIELLEGKYKDYLEKQEEYKEKQINAYKKDIQDLENKIILLTQQATEGKH